MKYVTFKNKEQTYLQKELISVSVIHVMLIVPLLRTLFLYGDKNRHLDAVKQG